MSESIFELTCKGGGYMVAKMVVEQYIDNPKMVLELLGKHEVILYHKIFLNGYINSR